MTKQTNMPALEVGGAAGGARRQNPPELEKRPESKNDEGERPYVHVGMRLRCIVCGDELYIRKYGVIVQIGCNRCGKHVGVGRHMIQIYKNAGVDWLRELYNIYTLA